MDCKDLQVTQTNAACLCNITDNASAEIKGVEAEFLFAATDRLRLSLAGSYVDAIRTSSRSAVGDGQRLLGSGNRLQRARDAVDRRRRSPLPLGQMGDALNFRVNYTWQSDMFWATTTSRKKTPTACSTCASLSPPSSPWAVALWGKNVTDELYRVNIICSSAKRCRSSRRLPPTASTSAGSFRWLYRAREEAAEPGRAARSCRDPGDGRPTSSTTITWARSR